MRRVPSLDVGAHEHRDLAGNRLRGDAWRRAQHETVREALDRADHDLGRQPGIDRTRTRFGRERIRCQIDEPIFQCVELCAEDRWELGLLEEHTVKTRRERVQRDHRVNDVRQNVVEACTTAQPLQVRFERRRPLGEVLVHERDEDRVLVGEVLVERADRYPGPLGDPVGGPGGVALTLENLSSRFEDRLDGRPRSRLLGELARLEAPVGNASSGERTLRPRRLRSRILLSIAPAM